MKLPKGMFRRGNSYYVRSHGGGRDRWISLGRDLNSAKQRLLGLRAGGPILPRMTVDQASRMWLESYVMNARNPKGQRLAAVRVEKYLSPALGDRFMSKVSSQDLRAYRLWLEKQGPSVQTVKHILSDACCLFRWAEETGHIDRTPVPRRFLPRVQEKPPVPLSEEEIRRVSTVPEPYGFVVRLALATGLRWAELCRSQASHVERGMLTVSQTKSGKVRRIPLTPEILAEIRGRVGRLVPFSVNWPEMFSRRVRKHSGVDRFYVHLMRHTFACRWLEAGGSLVALQQLLGHASVTTTQRYGRLGEGAIRREMETVAVSVAARD